MGFCDKRRAGVLMHISSLPSPYGTGVFGKTAVDFARFLADCGFSFWQILPMTPVDAGNSPYASESAFAGYPAFIDPEMLLSDGLITREEEASCRYDGSPYTADYAFSLEKRMAVLRAAFERFTPDDDLDTFVSENSWVKPYSLYKTLKSRYNGAEWWKWDEFSSFLTACSHYADFEEEAAFYIFVQYIFDRQWKRTKKRINAFGIDILGDIPMYVSLDSADVWSNTELFDIDPKTMRPNKCAGVPPDYFSADGQFWGNPLYRWDVMKKDGYGWWMDRLARSLSLTDALRIDHFRGFASYWAIPYCAKTAKEGSWMTGPGTDFFKKVFERFGDADIIAEDLGVFGEDVVELLDKTGFPGIRVVQFGFDPSDDSSHLPHNYPENSVACVGTHDNNTLLGWLWEADEENRNFALSYCSFKGGDWGEGGSRSPSCRSIIETVWRSPSAAAVIPFQDMCGFGADARMNVPGVPTMNWRFRTTNDTVNGVDREYFRKLNQTFRRTK